MAQDMEGLVAPSKLYSCLAVGRPIAVICPEGSFLKNLVIDAKCGESFRNGDGYGLAQFIIKLSQNPHLCASMGKAAREYFFSHFTRKIALGKYLEVIEKSLTVESNHPKKKL
jgi:glycosyltransferase involved in cell wall biosynthesis